MSAEFCEQLESAIRTDAAGRGLLACEEDRAKWHRGHLEPAVRSLVDRSREVAIVTGFAIPMPEGPVAETDGPPGAVMLADVLAALGRRVTLVTDEICEPVVQQAAESAGLQEVEIEACPVEANASREWLREFRQKHPALSHLIAIERVGPCHSIETLTRQRRSGAVPVGEFAERVPPSHFGRCHNMRGEVIDGITAPLYQLFESTPSSSLCPETIGIGDGGNEIGMGSIPWEEIASRLGSDQAAHPLLDIGNMDDLLRRQQLGGMALVAGIAQFAGRPQLALDWSEERQRTVLEEVVRNAGAVDGAARRRQATVDGLSDEDYFRPWRAIERLLTKRP